MDRLGLEPILREITEPGVPELTRVMPRAFDDDARRHLGRDRGGPDGYDDGNHASYPTKCGFERVVDDPLLGSPEGDFVYRKVLRGGELTKPPARGG